MKIIFPGIDKKYFASQMQGLQNCFPDVHFENS